MDLEPCTRKTWSNGQNEIRVGLILDCLELFIMCQDILIRPKDVIVSWSLLVFHVMTHPACSEIVEMIFSPLCEGAAISNGTRGTSICAVRLIQLHES